MNVHREKKCTKLPQHHRRSHRHSAHSTFRVGACARLCPFRDLPFAAGHPWRRVAFGGVHEWHLSGILIIRYASVCVLYRKLSAYSHTHTRARARVYIGYSTRHTPVTKANTHSTLAAACDGCGKSSRIIGSHRCASVGDAQPVRPSPHRIMDMRVRGKSEIVHDTHAEEFCISSVITVRECFFCVCAGWPLNGGSRAPVGVRAIRVIVPAPAEWRHMWPRVGMR